jgi:hypothetical protein
MKQVWTNGDVWRGGLGIFAATSLLLAGCSSSANSTANQPSPGRSATSVAKSAPAVARGAERGIGDVPWSQVGPGWMLAVWTPVTAHHPGSQRPPGEPTPETATTVLYLVSPAGDRYSITGFPPADGARDLRGWSGDGSHALFTPKYGTKGDSISIDLHTGARTVVPRDGMLAYTHPDGKALLLSTSYNGNEPGTLKRIDMAGNEQFVYPTKDLGGAGQFSGDYSESPDGTQLVLGTANLGNKIVPRTDNSLVVMGNDGSMVRTLSAPMPKAMCAPDGWWSAGVILARCTEERSAAQQFWKVPLDGGKPTALTAVNPVGDDDPRFEDNLGNWSAVELPSGIFLSTSGACGSTFVSRLMPDGGTRRVHIPGVSDSVGLVGASGDKLVVVGQVGCGGGTSLLTYDPAANTSTVLLGPPVSHGGVEHVVLYPRGQ